MNTLRFLALVLSLFSLISCRTDLDFEPLTKPLRVSADTIYLDTVFSTQRSTSAVLKIYNESHDNVSIAQIKLAQGDTSDFELLIDGKVEKTFANVEILAKDSLSVFIHVNNKAFQSDKKEYLSSDDLKIIGSGIEQNVNLVTLIKDAHFLYPKKDGNGSVQKLEIEEGKEIEGFYLTDNTLRLTANKPYIIYGYAIIPEQKELTIDEGAILHFYHNSGIVGLKGSSIQANGRIEKPVVFRNNRLDVTYRYANGQWSGIQLNQPSSSKFENVLIENAKIGLHINGGEKVELNNLQLYNHTYHGLLASQANVVAKNLVVAHTQNAGVVFRQGGNYLMQHATIVNYGTRPNQVALSVEENDVAFERIKIQNSLLYSSSRKSFTVTTNDWSNISFQNNALKDGENNAVMQSIYQQEANFSQTVWINTLNSFVIDFIHPKHNNFIYSQKMTDFIGKGSTITATEVPFDALGKSRKQSPDLGAYQHAEVSEE